MARPLLAIRFPAILPAILLALLLSGCAGKAPSTRETSVREGEFFRLAGETALPLDRAALLARLARADYILVGEGHTSVADHQAQQRLMSLLGSLDKAAGPATLALEMVPRDLQPVLDRYNAGHLDVAALEAALDWTRTWGHPFELYAPVLAEARRQGLRLAAANAPKRVVEAVRSGGLDAVPLADLPYSPAALVAPRPEQVEAMGRMAGMHAAMTGKNQTDPAMLERFLRVQSLWDATMAETMVRWRRETGRPVVLLAGSGHVEAGWGVAHRLARFDPAGRRLLVAPWRDDPRVSLPEPDLGDVFFFAPPTHHSRMGYTAAQRQTAEGAVVIDAVTPGSPAERLGMRPGDVLVELLGRRVESLGDLHMAGMGKKDAPPEMVVLRQGRRVAIRLDAKQDAKQDARQDSRQDSTAAPPEAPKP